MPINYLSFAWNIIKMLLMVIVIYKSLNPPGLFTIPLLIIAFILFFKSFLAVIKDYNMRNV